MLKGFKICTILEEKKYFFLSHVHTWCCNSPLTSEVKCKSVTFAHAVMMKVLSKGCVVLFRMFSLNGSGT